jgi:MFS family permease
MSVAETSAPEGPRLSAGYRRYALVLLMLVYMLNYIDRQIISILAVPMSAELKLHDWQIGMMGGFAFALLYTVAGFPVARVAEWAHRPRIIAAATFVWSFFTFLCGFVQTFTHLFLARVGVGVGEAGCMPPAVSLIADYTSKSQRASAMSVLLAGAPLGMILGLVFGGLVADQWGWRAAFMIVGAPGLLFALVTVLTLKEPRRALGVALKPKADGPTFREVVRRLSKKRTYWLVVLAVTAMGCVSYGNSTFLALFFARAYEAELAALGARFGLNPLSFLGIALGLTAGVAATIGTLVGGALADRLGARDQRRLATFSALGAILAVPTTLLALFSPTAVLAFGLFFIPMFTGAFWMGPAYATVQGLAPVDMRATATALMLFIVNLVGLGLAPLGIGLISDVITANLGAGPAGLRWALAINCLFGLVGGALFLVAGRTIVRDLES